MLRLPQLDDTAALAEYLEDPEVMRFLGGRTVSRADTPAVIERWLERWRANDIGHFVVERRADGRVLGRVGFVVWDTRTWRQATCDAAVPYSQPELGWALARAYWGQGYATEAALAARAWSRRERGVAALISLIAPKNVASQRVALRLGARPTGIVELADTGQAEVWKHPG